MKNQNKSKQSKQSKQSKKRKKVDVVQYLTDHPECRNLSIGKMTEAMGISRQSLVYQLGLAVSQGKLHIAYSIEIGPRTGTRHKLKRLSDEGLINSYARVRDMRAQQQRDRDAEDKRKYMLEYMRQWRQDEANRQQQNRYVREWYLRMQSDPDKSRIEAYRTKERDRQREYRRKRRANGLDV